jgi:hypothetical protein
LSVLGDKDEYGLAVVHMLIGSLAGLLDPYIKDILMRVIHVQS